MDLVDQVTLISDFG